MGACIEAAAADEEEGDDREVSRIAEWTLQLPNSIDRGFITAQKLSLRTKEEAFWCSTDQGRTIGSAEQALSFSFYFYQGEMGLLCCPL